MKASVVSDRSTRTIEIEVTDAPDIDVTESYHKTPRVFRPDKARLNLVDNKARSIVIIGGLVKKSGQASEHVREQITYRNDAYRNRERLDQAPGWVRSLFGEAPAGVTSWTWVDRSNPEEVQAL